MTGRAVGGLGVSRIAGRAVGRRCSGREAGQATGPGPCD